MASHIVAMRRIDYVYFTGYLVHFADQCLLRIDNPFEKENSFPIARHAPDWPKTIAEASRKIPPMKLQLYVTRIERAWNILRVQGVRRFARSGTAFVRAKIGRPSAHQARYLEQKGQADRKFDTELGVSTGGVEYLHDLTIDSRNARFGTNHVAVDPAEFEQAMASVDIDLPSATFVDLGSGKGRALILAARYPFQHIIGVEFARELHGSCVVNLQRAFASSAQSDRITAILGDAADFAYPDGPLVLYLYNPFDAPVMAAAARHAFASWRASPRPMRVVYLNPVFGHEWTKAGWELIDEGIGRATFAPPAIQSIVP